VPQARNLEAQAPGFSHGVTDSELWGAVDRFLAERASEPADLAFQYPVRQRSPAAVAFCVHL